MTELPIDERLTALVRLLLSKKIINSEDYRSELKGVQAEIISAKSMHNINELSQESKDKFFGDEKSCNTSQMINWLLADRERIKVLLGKMIAAIEIIHEYKTGCKLTESRSLTFLAIKKEICELIDEVLS